MGAFNRAWSVLKNLNYRGEPLSCPRCLGTGAESESHPMYGKIPCQLCSGSGMLSGINPMAMQQYQSQLPDESYES